MRILIDVLHPAHVHVFRSLISACRERGDVVMVTARDKDVTIPLLDAFGIDHTVLSSQATGPVGLAREWVVRTGRLRSIASRFRPDIMLGIMGVSIAPVGRLIRRPAVVFYDTEIARRTNAVVYPLATAVVTPDSYQGERRPNQVVYPGYHELAYLHPDRFTPDRGVLRAFGIDGPEEPYSVVRFVGQDSSHDRHEVALGSDTKVEIVRRLATIGRVIVSSEAPVPEPIAHQVLTGPLHRIHDLLAFASVVVGESATMASEAAVLGVPSVFIGATSRGYVDDLADTYGLIDRYPPDEVAEALKTALTAAAGTDADGRAARHATMLDDKVDVTAWMLDFIDSLTSGAT